MNVTLLAGLIIGLFSGGLLTWLFFRKHYIPRHQAMTRQQVNEEYVVRDMFDNLQYTLVEREKEIERKAKDIISLSSQLSALQVEKDKLNEKLADFGQELLKMQENNREQFRNMATDILREKSKDFEETNKTSLDHILAPLKTDIGQFKKTIEDTRKEDIQEFTSLKKEIESLSKLNVQLSEDAQRLAGALRSDVKVQGNWGEDRLKLILESEGLQKYIDFTSEEVLRDTEEDRNRRPDIILRLPDGKHLVIDSKVSLNAYVAYFNASDPEEKKAYMKQLVRNINEHIDELSAKNYHALSGLNTPDFVFMFMHFESALTLALNENPEIFNRALKKKIVLITPSTLVATFKIVRLLWQNENRVRNVEEIFRQCGLLYDKFISFLDEMNKVGNNLRQAGNAYDDAMKRLKDGKRKGDTIIGKFEMIKDLDAKTTKHLPDNLITEIDLLFPEENIKAD
ncbi:DNA recombination protein RmuC [Chitinophaga sp. SYP-B3965]|uniref:DNA recombination protein RmuC n=1 Tax=Chitinophaga sp. SYP-B3965 TaxID=2663120 RepID=UPI0012997E40|nr:DNA recombination protein RmuC [Chitinophaga sp. SYP-B3965]MRG47138.1 DNA recombination protein RmuC [Chitinophaga sp. SYP-B3965]